MRARLRDRPATGAGTVTTPIVVMACTSIIAASGQATRVIDQHPAARRGECSGAPQEYMMNTSRGGRRVAKR